MYSFLRSGIPSIAEVAGSRSKISTLSKNIGLSKGTFAKNIPLLIRKLDSSREITGDPGVEMRGTESKPTVVPTTPPQQQQHHQPPRLRQRRLYLLRPYQFRWWQKYRNSDQHPRSKPLRKRLTMDILVARALNPSKVSLTIECLP